MKKYLTEYKKFMYDNKYLFISILILAIILIIIAIIYFYKKKEKFDTTATNNEGLTKTNTIIYTAGEAKTWVVPADVISVKFTVIGGCGGSDFTESGKFGGRSASISTNLNVLEGQTYYLYVGNNAIGKTPGESSDSNKIFSGKRGYNDINDINNINYYNGGGGAASFVSLGEFIPNNTNNIAIIAGGGGGIGNANINNKSATINGYSGGINSNGDGDGAIIASGNTTGGKGGSININTINTPSENAGGAGGGSNSGIDDGINMKNFGGGAGGSYVKADISYNTVYSTDTRELPKIIIEYTFLLSTIDIKTEYVGININTTITYITGQAKTWTVPAGVTSALFTVIGGKGGELNGTGIYAGNGANISTNINVIEGQKYYLYVGNNASSINTSIKTYGGLSSDINNIYSGGNGGDYGYSGGGGAASVVSLEEITSIRTSNHIIIAGGGGGSGYSSGGGNGVLLKAKLDVNTIIIVVVLADLLKVQHIKN